MSVQSTGAMSALKPTLKEIESYRDELNSLVKAEKFYEYYSRNDWTIAGEPINDWKALFRSWDKNEKRQPSKTEQARVTRSKMAIYGEDPEFTAYVDWFNTGGWAEQYRKGDGHGGSLK